jgi:hypothetical protein
MIRDLESPIDAALRAELGGEQFGTLADLVDLGLIAAAKKAALILLATVIQLRPSSISCAVDGLPLSLA